jgi:PAS domain S-box-containing protein
MNMVNSDWFYSSSEFQKFFQGATRSLIIKADAPTFTVLAASDKYLALTHKKREEVLGNGLFHTYPGAHSDPKEKDSVFSSFVRVISSRETDELPIFKYEISIGDNGIKETHYWTNVNEPILDEEGRVAYIINTTTNITAKILQQNALEESENRFRLMADGTDVMIALTDRSGEAIYFNKAWEVFSGRSVEELLKFGWVNIIDPDDRAAVMDVFGKAFEKKEPWVLESRLPAFDGQNRWLMVRGTPRFTADGAFAGYISSSVDITQQKEQQATLYKLNEELNKSQESLLVTNLDLQSSENRLNKILSELPVPVVVLMGPTQIITTTNDALLKFWDRSREEVLGKPMLEVFPELKRQIYPAIWKDVLESGAHITHSEILVTYKDKVTGEDRPFFIDYFCQPLEDRAANRIGVITTVVNVTEKVRSRKLIEEAESRLRLAIDSAKLGTWYVDIITRELKMSDRLKEIFGFYQTDEVTLEAATDQILEEYRADVVQAIENSISNAASYDVEYPLKGFRDGAIRWVRATGKLYEDVNGNGNFSGTMQDITQRKNEEQRKDDFLSIASHELKTPVTALKGSLQLLSAKKDDLSNPIVPRLITQANVSVEKITHLIDDLLNTTRTNQGQLHLNYTEFTIVDMLEKCCHHIRMGGKHELILQGDRNLKMWADEIRIDQVVVNLVNNAAKYAPDQREIYLIVEDLGDWAKISVKDSGPGIPQDKVAHLFDRYYRVDYGGIQYSGLGLGLYISAEIIKKHKGEIGVNTGVGQGSTFWFTVPIKTL